MSESKKPAKGRPRRSPGPAAEIKNKTIKLNQTLSDRLKARKFARSTRKATYLSTLPKERWRRILYRLHPKRVIKYWFSREGAIMALKITGVGIVAVFLLIVCLFAYYRKDLPNVKDISGSKVGGSVTYYDRTGKTVLWQDYNDTKRIGVEGDQISKFMKDATVATEDKDFFKHGAFDVRGIIRAGLHDVFGGGGTQGGSTITQQLVKNDQGWTYDHSIERKLKEIILSVELERDYSKDDILTAYMNVAPYGYVDRGVEAASRDYFGISAKDLSLAQAAMLASIPKAPTAYSPYSDPRFNPAATANYFDQAALLARQHYVLDSMAKQHMITQAEADAAKKVDVLAGIHPLQSRYQGIQAPYFVLAAKQDLQNKLGAATIDLGGLKVITTVDMSLQQKAEQLIADNVSNLRRRTAGLADDEAVILEDVQTGQINALVGGEDFNADNDYSKLNFATKKISPGSSFKPYDYVTLIDNNNNVGAGSVLYDQDTPLPARGYQCTDHSLPPPKGTGNCLKDYDFKQPGPVTLRYGLGGSRNVSAVKAMLSAVPNDTSAEKATSINKVISTASAMMDNPYLKDGQRTYNCYGGIEEVDNATDADRIPCGASSAIGDGAYVSLQDHVNGLSTMARLGSAIPRTYILNVTNGAGKSIYKWAQPKGKQVVKPDSAYIVNDIAADPNASYLPGSCSATDCNQALYKFHRYQGWHFAIKTGTTNYGFDGLMASWSTKYAVLSWVGNHTRNKDITSITRTSMEYLTEPLTKGLMQAAHNGKKPVNWTQPPGIKVLPAYRQTVKVSAYGEVVPGPATDLFPSWYTGGSKTNTSQVNDKVSGKAATSCTPDLAKDTQANGNAASWNIDIFVGGRTSTGSSNTSSTPTAVANDDVHNCSDTPPAVSITAPSTCDANSGGCTITVTATQGSPHPLSGGTYTTAPAGTVTVKLGDQAIDSRSIPTSSSDAYSYSFTYVPTASQNATLTATVVDSVLYSGSGTTDHTVNFVQASAVSSLTYGGSTSSGGITTINWSGGTGPYTVYKSGVPISANCTATSSSSCTAPAAVVPHGTNITIKDSSTPQQTTSGST